MLIDTHAHLDMQDFEKDLGQTLNRALQVGITHIVTIGIDFQSSLRALELANTYPLIFSTTGFHPHNAKEVNPPEIETLAKLALEPKVVGWGEIGLDFYRRYSPPARQIDVFEQQWELAFDLGLPVIIHIRDAHAEALTILQKRKRQKGVIHCFSGNYDLAMKYIDLGYHISLPGTVTYKNALKIQEVAARIPMERMLIETDAPFLAPVPFRGKRNEPSYVKYTAQKIAELRHMRCREVAQQTSENAKMLFNLPEFNPADHG
jgi:TatD DNase family protein